MVTLKEQHLEETVMSIEKLGPREKGRKNKGRPAPARIRQIRKAMKQQHNRLRRVKNSPSFC